jgi:hypothetical protein
VAAGAGVSLAVKICAGVIAAVLAIGGGAFAWQHVSGGSRDGADPQPRSTRRAAEDDEPSPGRDGASASEAASAPGGDRRTADHPAYITIRGEQYSTDLRRLDLSDMDLTDDELTPLRYMTELRILDLSDNQVSDFSAVAGLTDLAQLYVFRNRVSDIGPLSGLTNLTHLGLSSNQISDLTPLSGLTNMSIIYLQNNPIRDLTPLAGMLDLVQLAASSNQISDITPLSGLTRMTRLFLSGTQIRDITPLSGMTELIELHLVSNQISDLTPLSSLTKLSRLHLANNQISDISPLSNLTNLTELDLHYNHSIADWSPVAHVQEVVGRPEAAVPPEPPAVTSAERLAAAYRAYYEVLRAAVDTYGIGFSEEYDDEGNWLRGPEGIIGAALLDFDHDGLPELLITSVFGIGDVGLRIYGFSSEAGATELVWFDYYEFVIDRSGRLYVAGGIGLGYCHYCAYGLEHNGDGDDEHDYQEEVALTYFTVRNGQWTQVDIIGDGTQAVEFRTDFLWDNGTVNAVLAQLQSP